MNPIMKAPAIKRSKLEYEKLHSSFALNLHLHRYSKLWNICVSRTNSLMIDVNHTAASLHAAGGGGGGGGGGTLLAKTAALVGPGRYCSPRHRMPSIQDTRVQSAVHDVSSNLARHVAWCQSIPETRVQIALLWMTWRSISARPSTVAEKKEAAAAVTLLRAHCCNLLEVGLGCSTRQRGEAPDCQPGPCGLLTTAKGVFRLKRRGFKVRCITWRAQKARSCIRTHVSPWLPPTAWQAITAGGAGPTPWQACAIRKLQPRHSPRSADRRRTSGCSSCRRRPFCCTRRASSTRWGGVG